MYVDDIEGIIWTESRIMQTHVLLHDMSEVTLVNVVPPTAAT